MEKDLKAPDVTPVLEGEVQNVDEPTVTKRGLSARHINLMSIAGAIGTGLFVGISRQPGHPC